MKILVFVAILPFIIYYWTSSQESNHKNAFPLEIKFLPPYAISRLVYFLILIVGFYIAFMTIGINLTGIAVFAGALSLGIGFQTIINNFVSGILILFEKNVTPGDIIS